MITMELLLEAFFDCSKSKKSSHDYIEFNQDRSKNLKDLLDEINNKTYEVSPYTSFIVLKPVPREIFSAAFRDRIIHHLIALRMYDLIDLKFINNTYSCRPNKGTLNAVLDSQRGACEISHGWTRESYVMKLDLKSYFRSIPRILLWDKLEKYIFPRYSENDRDDLLWLYKKVILNDPTNNCKILKKDMWINIPKEKSIFTCKPDHGLPIGNYTSQISANFYLSDFDDWMYSIFGNYYYRYMDDILIFHDSKEFLLQMRQEIYKRLEILELELHPNKFYLQEIHKGFRFLNCIIKPGRLYTSERTISGFKENIFNINSLEQEYLLKNIRQIQSIINSYLGSLSHTNSFKLRKKLYQSLSSSTRKLLIPNSSFTKVSLNGFSDYDITKYLLLKP